MNLGEIISLLTNEECIDDRVFNGIKTDSKEVEEGDIFIALKGKNFDGNQFVDEAFTKGAILCITELDYPNSIKMDGYYALYKIAKYIKKKYNKPLIAITGSNGKTTVKELLSYVLESKYKVLKNDNNENNIVGVSKTLFKLDDTYDLIVMELGTNKKGEISHLSKLCSPDLGIITNIGTSHLEFFENRKSIFQEKYSIINGMKIPRLIVNGDSKYLNKLNKFKCGLKLSNDLVGYNINIYDEYLTFNIFLDKEYEIRFNTPCKHFITDILLVIKASLDYGININTIIDRINTFKMVDKRFNIETINNITIINDCYNASYESVIGGINYLKSKRGKKLLILGDILELGDHTKKIHKKINFRLKFLRNKDIITVGKYKYIKGTHYDDSNLVKPDISKYKYIYIKGSRRVNLDIIYDYIKTIIYNE